MENLKRYITRKNLLMTSFITGVIGVVMLLIYFLTINTMSASALSMLSFLCILFYVSFFLLLLLTAAYAFHIFYDKQRSTTLYVLAGCTVVGLLASLFSISTVNVIFQVINGNFSAIWSLSASALNVDTWLIIMMIGQIAAGVLAGYLRFVKKAEELSSEDLSQMQDTAKQVGDAAATAARKAAGSVSEGTAKLSEKWKNYYHTEKGKKTVRLVGIAAVAVIVVIIAISIWSATRTTPIDLTSSCEVTFEGYDGEGDAYINCDVDYDINNPQIASFVYDVEYTIDNDGALSNGDKVILHADYSEETARNLKLGVENAEREITVEGLTEVYRTYDDIPKEVSDGFASAAQAALEAELKEDEGSTFGPDTITINSCENIGVYYQYSSSWGEGSVYYLFRTDVTEEDEYSVDNIIDYYYVSIDPISSEYTLDLAVDSDDIDVSGMYLYDDEKNDAQAGEWLKSYYSDLQVVSENFSDETYQDTTTEK